MPTQSHLINLDQYPIHQSASKAYHVLLKQVRNDLATDGCSVLKGFLTRAGVKALCKEADTVSGQGHKSFNCTNPYFSKDDPSLAVDHPVRQFFERSNAFISADNFRTGGPLRLIHDTKGFDGFIQNCLQEKQFYRYADPLADVIVNMAQEGNGFPWHFDTNNFTVTLEIQNATSGGAFEYAPNIRTSGENFDEVAQVLAGTSDKVTRLNLEPGDLQLFRGRYSLHRVAPLEGSRPRYVAIFSYVDQPGMVGAPERTKQLYGKVLPIHMERAGLRSDAYLD